MPSWPHAPTHWLFEPGSYIVTAATLHKAPLFLAPERRDLLQATLFDTTAEFGWRLDAWAVLSNHYHFVARSPGNPSTLKRVLGKLHMQTAKQVNRLDGTPGRKVWFEYWDTRLTYERSYFARLRYVHNNPAKHGIVPNSLLYPWCSASWFAEHASPAFREIINRFKTDTLNVPDDF
jgi:putative transposase